MPKRFDKYNYWMNRFILTQLYVLLPWQVSANTAAFIRSSARLTSSSGVPATIRLGGENGIVHQRETVCPLVPAHDRFMLPNDLVISQKSEAERCHPPGGALVILVLHLWHCYITKYDLLSFQALQKASHVIGEIRETHLWWDTTPVIFDWPRF